MAETILATSKIEPSSPFASTAPDVSSLTGCTADDSSGNGVGCGAGFVADSIQWVFPASALTILELRIQLNYSWAINLSGVACNITDNSHTRLNLDYSVNSGLNFLQIVSPIVNGASGSINFLIPGGVVDPSVVRVRAFFVAYATNCAASPACVTQGIISDLKLSAVTEFVSGPSAHDGQILACV